MSDDLQQPSSNITANQAIQSILMDQIAQTGPMTVSEFMQIVLGHPVYGYYNRQNPIGAEGDFTTAPEISGLFGEMCGAYIAHMYNTAGQPDLAQIFEFGPGRGSLMADMRHAWRQTMPSLLDLPLNFVETSLPLRKEQKQRINAVSVTWHNDLTTLPDTALFGIANEFFDALPIDQAIWRQKTWRHRLVGINKGNLCFIDGHPLTPTELTLWQINNHDSNFVDGAVVEYCQAAEVIIQNIAHRIAIFGGAFLVIDYGKTDNQTDSLQAVAAQKPVDIFYEPGNADISHWVDFAALRQSTHKAGARFIGPVTQADFLMKIGLRERAENATLTSDAQGRRAIEAAVDRLVSSYHMGSAFKVGLVVPPGEGEPVGFTTGDMI